MHRYRKGAQDVSDAPLRASSVGTVQPPVRAQTFSGQVQSFNSYSSSLDPQTHSSALNFSYEPQQPAAYGRVSSASPSPYPQQSPAPILPSSYSQLQSAKPSPYGQTTSAPSPYSQTQSVRPSPYYQQQGVSPYAQTQSAPSPFAQSQSAPSPYGSPFYVQSETAPSSYAQALSATSPYNQSQSTRPSPYSQVQSRPSKLSQSQEVGDFPSQPASAPLVSSLEQPSTSPKYQSPTYQAYSPPPLPYPPELRSSDLSPVPEASHHDEVKEDLSVSSAAEKLHAPDLSANFGGVPIIPARHSEDDRNSKKFENRESAEDEDLGLVHYGGDPVYSEIHEPIAADFEDLDTIIKPESIAEALPPSVPAATSPPESIAEARRQSRGATTTPPPPPPESIAESLPPSIAATPSEYLRVSRSSSKQSMKAGKEAPAPGSTVIAVWDFDPSEEGELAFKKGDEITVIESVYRDWWRGEMQGKTGIFPTNYVEVVRNEVDNEAEKKSVSRKSSNSSIGPFLFHATRNNDLKQPDHTVIPEKPPTSPSLSVHSGRMLQDADKEAYAHSSDIKSTDPPVKATLYLSATDASTIDTFAEEAVMQASENIEMDQVHPSLMSRLMNLLAPRKHQYKQTEATGASLEAAIDHANASFWSRTRQHSAGVVADFALKMNTATSIELDANTNINTYTDEDLFRKAIGSPLFMGFRIIYVLDNQNMAETAISQYFSAASGDHSWKRFRAWSSRIVPARAALRKASRFARILGTRLRRDFACGFEHNDRFSTSLLSGEMHRLLDVVKAAHDCGAYHRCLFNTVSQTPRHAVYFCHDDNRDQRTLIIVHSRPLHYVSLDNYPRSWASDDIWRNLREEFPHNVSVTSHDQVMFILLRQVFLKLVEEVVQTWTAKLEDLQNQFGELESSIYADPSSNDDLSTDLWKLSKHLLEARELMGHHVGTIAWIQRTVNQLATHHASKTANVDAQAFWESMITDNWLQEQVVEMDELAQSIEENLREPIDKTLDLMYKSISIRDAKLSLELNASLWRLSWITFIFLPLTFLVGFFGMNVDTFHSDPSIKWYFVTAVPFMALVFLFWLLFKKTLSRRYDNRRRRLERAARAQKKNN